MSRDVSRTAKVRRVEFDRLRDVWSRLFLEEVRGSTVQERQQRTPGTSRTGTRSSSSCVPPPRSLSQSQSSVSREPSDPTPPLSVPGTYPYLKVRALTQNRISSSRGFV